MPVSFSSYIGIFDSAYSLSTTLFRFSTWLYSINPWQKAASLLRNVMAIKYFNSIQRGIINYLFSSKISHLTLLAVFLSIIAACMNFFLNMNCWVNIMLLVCIFSEITIWHWTIYQCALSWSTSPFHSQLYSVACDSSCMVVASQVFPCLFWHICWCHPCSAIRQSCWWDLIVIASNVTMRHNLIANFIKMLVKKLLKDKFYLMIY